MFSTSKKKKVFKSLTNKTAYDSIEIINQLEIDFYKKCYICGGEAGKDFRVEHFVPHLGSDSLKYDWNNLFYSCDYCNGIKSHTYNKGNKKILNSISDEINEHILHLVEQVPICNIKLVAKDDTDITTNTIELLTKVYIKHKSSAANRKKREALRQQITKEMMNFIDCIYEVMNEENGKRTRDGYVRELKDHLDPASKFWEFKKDYLLCNESVLDYVEKITNK